MLIDNHRVDFIWVWFGSDVLAITIINNAKALIQNDETQ